MCYKLLTGMDTAAQHMRRAFLAEYRQLAGEAEAVLSEAARAGAAPLRVDLKGLSLLCHLTHVLRDAGLFLNFPQLAAVARPLFELLRPRGTETAPPALTPPQTQFLLSGFQLAARLVEGVAGSGVEPRLVPDLERFAAAARDLALPWDFPAAAAGDAPAPAPRSDSQKVDDLLAETALPAAAPAPAAPRVAASADMLNVFLQDADEIIDHAEQDLLALDKDPERLHDLLRQFHTLKGNSGLMGFDVLQQFSHRLESVLQDIRDQKIKPPPGWLTLFLEAVDQLRRAVAELAKHGTTDNLKLDLWTAKLAIFGGASAALDAAPASGPDAAPGGAPASAPDAAPSDAPALPAARGGVRVNVERLDQLNDLAGELVIAAAVVQHLSAVRAGIDPERHNRACHQLNLITSGVQDLAMAIRMVPIESAFRRLPRLARELAEKTGKPIDLQLVGAETEVDRRVTELIADPLVHMVRNAVDHGLELPEERRRRGKPETGTIRIEALHRSGEVWVTVSDDGRGLQREKILSQARARGLLAAGATPTDEELLPLIFEPGFSTAAVVTEVSGRGVGLDVVKRNIERLRGRIEAQSTPGLSTTLTIRLPLTMAVIQGMIVGVGSEQFILPMTGICESLRPGANAVRQALGAGEMIALRGTTIPLFRLAELFMLPGCAARPEDGVVTIVEDGERRVALLLDELLGQQRVVVKSLGDSLGRLPGVSGASILADGRVRLILDVAGLIRLAHERKQRKE